MWMYVGIEQSSFIIILFNFINGASAHQKEKTMKAKETFIYIQKKKSTYVFIEKRWKRREKLYRIYFIRKPNDEKKEEKKHIR